MDPSIRMRQNKILIVDDDEDVLMAASMVLRTHIKTVHTLSETDKLMNKISRENYDAILLDMNFTNDTSSGKEGFFWLKTILTYNPAIPVVLMTAYGDVERAVKAMKEGAVDYILKPWNNDKLLEIMLHIIDCAPVKTIEKSSIPEQAFIGNSACMMQIFDIIEKVAATDANVLITGENGTGKELVAREIHRKSLRSNAIFVPVDLGSLSESIFESELFGHVKGAFTDAQKDRTGRFEEASGGTLFLDEIGNLNTQQQSKLLTAIQHKQITRMGANKMMDVDVRIIAATNGDLYKMIAQQLFRQDLLYRLNTVEIRVPPLRERKEDIPLLFRYYLDFFGNKYKKEFHETTTSRWVQVLCSHHWPGNIRELRHTIERAVIMSNEGELVFSLPIINDSPKESTVLNLEELEKKAVLEALKKYSGNISKASLDLGLTRAALYRRMEKYEIQ